jgi:magnesium chelatase family protein
MVRRPLDAALNRGALTLRGFDRVLRVAWSLADLEGRPQLSTDHIGRALYLKKGIAN